MLHGGSDTLPTDNVGAGREVCHPPFKFPVIDGSIPDLARIRQFVMSVDALRPQNTQNARAVGVKAFKRFLQMENVDLEYVFDCMYKNPDGRCMKTVLEKFALHLAFTVGAKEKMLKANTVMSYFRHVKKWLLELFPQCEGAIEQRLLEVARILESHMKKRATGAVTKQAPACTKKDLSVLVRYLYTHASCSTDYQDAALITMLWYVFGRASDFSLLQKESLSVCSGKNFFVRLVRIKTTDQQGLTLYPDEDITTCPILALSIALAMQSSPCSQLLENVRPAAMSLDLEALESLPLMELLLQAEQPLSAPLVRATGIEKKPKTEKKKAPAPLGIHNQINRLLGRISKPAGVAVPLTSHSFRRGGAQHANGEAGMSMQWISDRGGWNLSSQQKIWSYVFNTTQEDQRVAKVLSGWTSTSRVPLDCIDVLDDDVKSRVRCFTSLLFNTCAGLQDPRLNVCGTVLDALAGRLLRALPLVRDLQPSAPIVARVDACAAQAGLRRDQLLAVSMYLQQTYNDELQRTEIKPTNDTTVWGQQTALIRELLDANRLLVNRLEALEAKEKPAGAESAEPIKNNEQVSDPPKAPRKNSPATHLSVVWFEWYAGEPRLWSKDAERKKRSEARHVVAFMKLFLVRGFSLDPDTPTYRDDVLRLGHEAEQGVAQFLAERGIKSTGSSAILKHMRVLHKRGKLNHLIREYKERLAFGLTVDPCPRDTRDILPLIEA